MREAEKSIGHVNYNLTEKQISSRAFSRSLYIIKDVKKGELLSEENIKSIRPGFGMHPKYYKSLIGKIINQDIKKGTRMDLSLIKN